MEGGGGVMGDPIVLVQKYFGPRVQKDASKCNNRRDGASY